MEAIRERTFYHPAISYRRMPPLTKRALLDNVDQSATHIASTTPRAWQALCQSIILRMGLEFGFLFMRGKQLFVATPADRATMQRGK